MSESNIEKWSTLKEVQEYFGGDTRKVFANMYLDDRSANYRSDLGVFATIPPETL